MRNPVNLHSACEWPPLCPSPIARPCAHKAVHTKIPVSTLPLSVCRRKSTTAISSSGSLAAVPQTSARCPIARRRVISGAHLPDIPSVPSLMVWPKTQKMAASTSIETRTQMTSATFGKSPGRKKTAARTGRKRDGERAWDTGDKQQLFDVARFANCGRFHDDGQDLKHRTAAKHFIRSTPPAGS